MDGIRILSAQLVAGGVQIIAATALSAYGTLVQRHKMLAGCFEEIVLAPLNEAECKVALGPLTQELQTFHNVTFQNDAISAGLTYAKQRLPRRSTLPFALDVLDKAATRARMQREEVPEDMRDVQNRIRFITQRMENAIANH